MENRNPYDSANFAEVDLPSPGILRLATLAVAVLQTVSGVFIAWILYKFVSMYFIYAILSVVIAWTCVVLACLTTGRQIWLLAIQATGFMVLQIGPLACFVVPGLDRILGAPLRWIESTIGATHNQQSATIGAATISATHRLDNNNRQQSVPPTAWTKRSCFDRLVGVT